MDQKGQDRNLVFGLAPFSGYLGEYLDVESASRIFGFHKPQLHIMSNINAK